MGSHSLDIGSIMTNACRFNNPMSSLLSLSLFLRACPSKIGLFALFGLDPINGVSGACLSRLCRSMGRDVRGYVRSNGRLKTETTGT